MFICVTYVIDVEKFFIPRHSFLCKYTLEYGKNLHLIYNTALSNRSKNDVLYFPAFPLLFVPCILDFEILRFRQYGHASAISHAREHGETRGNSSLERDRESGVRTSEQESASAFEEGLERQGSQERYRRTSSKEREREKKRRIHAPEEANNKKKKWK